MRTLILVLICLLVTIPCNADIITVDPNGTGDYPTIQAAIDVTTDGDEVVLMPGTYTGEGNQDLDFAKGLAKGQTRAITIRSTNPNDPLVVAATIIDCEYKGKGFYFVNSEGNNSVLDGLTITNAGDYDYDGGGIYCNGSSPTVANCRILSSIGYFGGGICNDYGSSPMLVNCVFVGNQSAYGGGMGNILSNPTVTNCVFSGNTADDQGGGMYNDNSSPTVTNCTFSGNLAEYEGGGILNNYYSNTILTNCILWSNKSPSGAQIYNTYMSSPTITYSNVQGNSSGKGNINAEPLFVDPNGLDGIIGTEDDNLRLSAESPCVDAGDNSVVNANIPDLDGNPRIINGIVDMGPYEFFSTNTPPVADAGQDQNVYACAGGRAEVKLDGLGSFDEDGDELEYLWTWEIEGTVFDANGVSPIIELPAGLHTVNLTVDDGLEVSEPNSCVIEVIEGIEVDLQVLPKVINRKSRMRRFLAVVQLPAGIDGNDIDGSFWLYPGEIEPRFCRFITVNGSQKLFMVFDKSELMAAVPDNGPVVLEIEAQLISGRCLYGSDRIRIIRRGRGPQEEQTGRRKGTRFRRNRVQKSR